MKDEMNDRDLSNGREECSGCGSRCTEVVYNARSNYRRIECLDCGKEWKDYTGEPCEECGSQNTVRESRGVVPHSRKVTNCRNCGHES